MKKIAYWAGKTAKGGMVGATVAVFGASLIQIQLSPIGLALSALSGGVAAQTQNVGTLTERSRLQATAKVKKLNKS